MKVWTSTWLLTVCVLWALPAIASPEFPKLTGRVVDSAGMLSSAARQRLDSALSGHERASTNQLVVVTLADLQGYDIETYGHQLGRHWKIGRKGADNGVLLIVAKQERKVRIEVGYGLEGQLTDAISANIIQSIILPTFKRGQFEHGIEAGATAIVQALGGEYKMRAGHRSRNANSPLFGGVFLIIMLISFVSSFFGGGGSRRRRRGLYAGGLGYGLGSGGYRSGGFGGGGFSGGGGGFGGGGASGGW